MYYCTHDPSGRIRSILMEYIWTNNITKNEVFFDEIDGCAVYSRRNLRTFESLVALAHFVFSKNTPIIFSLMLPLSVEDRLNHFLSVAFKHRTFFPLQENRWIKKEEAEYFVVQRIQTFILFEKSASELRKQILEKLHNICVRANIINLVIEHINFNERFCYYSLTMQTNQPRILRACQMDSSFKGLRSSFISQMI